MTSAQRLRFAIAGCLAVLGLAAGGFVLVRSTTAGAQSSSQPFLTDLVQVAPDQIGIERARSRGRTVWRLIFRSAVEVPSNRGRIVLTGRRPNRRTQLLTVDQYVDVVNPANGEVVGQEVVRDVGRMRYTFSSDHQHFHYLGFDRYELRRVRDGRRVTNDRKTGFCLGDRYRAGTLPARSSPVPPQTRVAPVAGVVRNEDLDQDCGAETPGKLKVTEGITPGNGDDYRPSLEGQYLNITNVAPGRYWLVHRANSDRRLRELRFANNVSSALIVLRRRTGGAPTVQVLRRCTSTARCS
jgi:hypothetical protein